MKLATIWAAMWLGIVVLSFISGQHAIPRLFGHNSAAGLLIGGLLGAVIVGPLCWVAITAALGRKG